MTKSNPYARFTTTADVPESTPADASPAPSAVQVSAADRRAFLSNDAPRRTYFDLTTAPRAAGVATVQSKGKIGHGDYESTAYLQLPEVINRRLTAAVVGAKAPAIVALIEFALDELDRQNLTLLTANEEGYVPARYRR